MAQEARWSHPSPLCSTGSWTGEDRANAAPRLVMTDGAGRWVAERSGGWGTVNEIAVELGCDWHTINDTVIAYGNSLVDDPDRVGETTALGLDETLTCLTRIRQRVRRFHQGSGERSVGW